MFTTSFNEKNAISVKKNFPASIFHVLNCFIENEKKMLLRVRDTKIVRVDTDSKLRQ